MNERLFGRDQTLRYSRQLILEDIGYKGQEKLLKSKVFIAGVGGLGSPILFYLAAAGVGTLGFADFDTVSLSNLNRQILHFTDDIGVKKVDSAEDKLKKLNPDMVIRKYPIRLNADNIEDIVREYDVVIDALDNLASRYLLNDCCYFLKKPVVEGAIIGFEGLLMTIIPDKTPCYRCIYPVPPQDGVVPTCSDIGIIGAIAGTIGSLQALEAVKLIAGIGDTLSGRILIFDGLRLGFSEIECEKSLECPLCGENPTVKELIEYEIKCKLKTVPL